MEAIWQTDQITHIRTFWPVRISCEQDTWYWSEPHRRRCIWKDGKNLSYFLYLAGRPKHLFNVKESFFWTEVVFSTSRQVNLTSRLRPVMNIAVQLYRTTLFITGRNLQLIQGYLPRRYWMQSLLTIDFHENDRKGTAQMTRVNAEIKKSQNIYSIVKKELGRWWPRVM